MKPTRLLSFVASAALAVVAVAWGWAQGVARDITVEEMRTERRVALVIGNSAYATGTLRNPGNDARAIARTLREVEFEVLAHENLDQQAMWRAFIAFGERLRGAGVGLFYFAGHGMQVSSRNYLIPIGAEIRAESEVEVEAVDAAAMLARMEGAKNRLNIVILDACRNNPFERGFRSSARGLASIDAPSGTLIAYAAAPGRLARDGDGPNSPYTGELLKVMRVRGLKIEEVFKQVRRAVQSQTRGEQVPWESSSLVGDFMFALPAVASVPPPPPVPGPTVKVKPRQEFGTLVFSSKVPGVEVWLGEDRIGETRAGAALVTGNLAIGSYRIRARKAGYQEWEHEVKVAANQRTEVAIAIEPLRPELPKVTMGEDGAEMVLVPEGKFWMGSDEETPRGEKPRHRIYLNAFYIDKYEVTNELYQRCVNAGACKIRSRSVQDPTSPVSALWIDAEAYCRWVGKRLPTEAEWEKAAACARGCQASPTEARGLVPWGREPLWGA